MSITNPHIGTLATAEQLLKDYEEQVTKKQKTAWSPPKQCAFQIVEITGINRIAG